MPDEITSAGFGWSDFSNSFFFFPLLKKNIDKKITNYKIPRPRLRLAEGGQITNEYLILKFKYLNICNLKIDLKFEI